MPRTATSTFTQLQNSDQRPPKGLGTNTTVEETERPSTHVSMSRARWLVECCFTSTETVGPLGMGAQNGHLDFHTAPEFAHAGHIDLGAF